MTTFTVETVPGPRGINRILLRRNGEPLPPSSPTPSARTAIPATAAAMREHFRTGPIPKRMSQAPFGDTPPPTGAEAIALRERAEVTQRQAAAAAGVSRSMVSEMKRPRTGRFTKGSSLQAERYIAWLRQQAAQAEASE